MPGLVLMGFSGTEAVNELFEFEVSALSGERLANPVALLGQHAGVRIDTLAGGDRIFGGIVTSVRDLGPAGDGHGWGLVLRPWFWLLGHRQNARIFHNQTVLEIFETVLGDHGGLADHEARLYGSYPVLEYTVQYRESDLDFLRRLLEEHGISFHFEASEGRHVMVLTDSPEGFRAIPGGSRPFIPVADRHRAKGEHFSEWSGRSNFATGRVAMADYDFRNPDANMRVETGDPGDHAHSGLESYEYTGFYGSKIDPGESGAQKTRHARTRLSMFRARAGEAIGAGDVQSLAPGQIMGLTGHPDGTANTDWLCIGCSHDYVAESYRSGEQMLVAGDDGYHGEYRFVRKDAPFAPERRTPPARVHGPQTGIVAGESGEEIDCDEYGRILVHLHWDRETAWTMRCRVAQSWAGNAWGSVFIPRIGMEVVVEFLDGDPDRPIVTGCVYNGKNDPPFDLPGEKTKSGIKSRSSLGGDGYNMLVFEDKKGEELIDVHAEKDLNVLVENDETRDIRAHFSEKIGATSTIEVEDDHTLTVHANRSTRIDRNDGLDVGQAIEITAGSSITLKVGGSEIRMDGTSITLKALNVTIEAGAKLETRGGGMVEHKAGGILKVQAPLVTINS